MVRALGVPALMALVIGGCATRAPQAVAELTPIGEPVSCLLLQNVRESRVIDDQTIDFYTRSGDVYRNRLPNSCPQLGFERAFIYQTTITQLCNVDIITVLMTTSPLQSGASCGLGKFTPIAKPAR